MKRADRESSTQRGFGSVASNVVVEAAAQCRSIDGREDGRSYCSRRSCHSCCSSNEVVRSGKLDTSNYKDKWSPESNPGKTGEDHSIKRIAWLDGGQTDNASSKDQVADEQRLSNGPEFGAHIAPNYGG